MPGTIQPVEPPMSAINRMSPPLRLVPADGEERRRVDAELVFALKRGDHAAAEAIWDRYAPRVQRFLLRSLGLPEEEVEDLTQEVFIRIFTSSRAIREPAALSKFVMSVAVRVLQSELRRRRVRRWVRLADDGCPPDVIAEGGINPEARQALKRCYEILNELGIRERTAFALRFLEGMTLDEVASQLRVSLSTAKRLVNRSTAMVSAAVGGDEDLRGYFADEKAIDDR